MRRTCIRGYESLTVFLLGVFVLEGDGGRQDGKKPNSDIY
jgi:hypothetical protein